VNIDILKGTAMSRRLVTVVIAVGLTLLLVCSAAVLAAELIKARDGSGIFGYKDTPVLPWCGFHVHDPDRPAPPVITPGTTNGPPSDATVLFDGKDLSQWLPSDWKIDNGELIAVSGHLRTTESFGDCQIHLEWQTPNPPIGGWMDRGNNGVLLMGLFEIQIYDSYKTHLYPDGQAAAVYGQTPPRVNACRPPGEWQNFDIIFYAPDVCQTIYARSCRDWPPPTPSVEPKSSQSSQESPLQPPWSRRCQSSGSPSRAEAP